MTVYYDSLMMPPIGGTAVMRNNNYPAEQSQIYKTKMFIKKIIILVCVKADQNYLFHHSFSILKLF